MRKRLRRAEDLLARVEGALLAALLGVMVSLAFAQVVLRFFGAGLLWGETLLKHLVLWTGFLGAALAASQERHFAWEAAHLAAPPGLRPWLRLAAALCAAVVCALLLRAGVTYVRLDTSSGATLFSVGAVSIPAWAASAGIPVGFALVLLHSAFKAADAALEAAGR